ncbi:MAG: hypothetical protein ABIQ86_02080 [Steroidobacteraceae bacterium]
MKATACDMDRRSFLGSVSFVAGGAALSSWLPISLVQAAPACVTDACGDWQLDDICIAYPPYSLHMKSAVCHATVHPEFEPVDSHWIV